MFNLQPFSFSANDFALELIRKSGLIVQPRNLESGFEVGGTLKELIFHIGIPKTGSSALQVFLAQNRQILLKKRVDYLPIGEFALGAAGKVSSGNGAFLSRTMLPIDSPARIAAGERHVHEFLKAVRESKAGLGIVSSELFLGADKQALSALIARLRKMGVTSRCFYFVRNQVQFFASAYMQQVKRHGCTEQPADYVAREYKRRKFLMYQSFYLTQCDLFGTPDVICRVYEDAMETKKGLFHTMLEALSIGSDGLSFDIPDVNTSMSTRDLCIMLLLNRFQPRMKFSDMVIENAVQFGSAASGQIHNFLPHSLVEEIDRYYKEENDGLAKDYFHRKELFAIRASQGDQDRVSIDSLSISDVIAFFGGLLVRYDERLVALEHRLGKLSALRPEKK